MKNLSLLILTIVLFIACQSDQKIQKEFAGNYEVSLEAQEASKELKEAKDQIQVELGEAREEIKEEMENARQEIKNELGEDSNLGKAIGSFVEGMGHLANSMTDLGESLGGLGIDLGNDVLQNIRFDAEFQQDGDIVIGKRTRIRFRGDDLRWKIKDGNMLLWNEGDEDENDADVFVIKKIADKKWDLVGEEVTFHLIEKE